MLWESEWGFNIGAIFNVLNIIAYIAIAVFIGYIIKVFHKYFVNKSDSKD